MLLGSGAVSYYYQVNLDVQQVVSYSNMVSRFFWGWILDTITGNWSKWRVGATAEKGVLVDDSGSSILGCKLPGRRTLLEKIIGVNRTVVVAISWNEWLVALLEAVWRRYVTDYSWSLYMYIYTYCRMEGITREWLLVVPVT